MTGSGRGKWYRLGTKPCLEDYPRLAIKDLKDMGIFEKPMSGALTWGDKQHPWLSVRFTSTLASLSISSRKLGLFEPQFIDIDKTHCNFGGYRMWFICPDCNKRCAFIYSMGHQFLCRACHGVGYRSQRMTSSQRRYSKLNKLEQRLFEKRGDIRVKPKGMHWRTFAELHKVYLQLSK
ncbi:hypothetical protein [Neptuniibacter sp. QD48_11]|uniref:hypothetical protein n=1 Tax=Neptuniibacter sp. QD48_11 TaxID=3398211 RepID=UPI0039F569BA